MYIYIYVYIYIYIYVYMYMCIYIYTHIHLKISIKETAEKLRTLALFLYTHTTTTTTTQEMAGPWPIAERDSERKVWRKELVFLLHELIVYHAEGHVQAGSALIPEQSTGQQQLLRAVPDTMLQHPNGRSEKSLIAPQQHARHQPLGIG